MLHPRSLPQIICLWGTLLLSACGSEARVPVARNLLLISVDTLRADRLGCYGYGRGTSPNLDQLAAEGVRFQQATAPSPWTLPSHGSMFTGLSPKRHGAKGLKSALQPSSATLAQILQRAGFQTHAIVSSTILQGSGLERGFDELKLVQQGGPHPSAVTAECIDVLKQLTPEQPFFLLAHYIDPHTDYGSLEPFRSRFVEPYDGIATGRGQQIYRSLSGDLELSAEDVAHLSNLYDGGIAQVDDQIELLFEYMRSEQLWEQTLVVLTSDHGEEFLDHGGLMHGFNHHEEMIRVPLLLRGPGLPKGFVSQVPVSLMDIVPTCLAQLGLPSRPNLDGAELQSFWEQQGEKVTPRRFYYEADWDAPLPGRRSLAKGWDRAIRVGRYKLHFNLKTQVSLLYDLQQDPLESTDLSSARPDIVQLLRSELEHYLDTGSSAGQTEPEAPLNEKELQKLMQLGYAGPAEEEDE